MLTGHHHPTHPAGTHSVGAGFSGARTVALQQRRRAMQRRGKASGAGTQVTLWPAFRVEPGGHPTSVAGVQSSYHPPGSATTTLDTMTTTETNVLIRLHDEATRLDDDYIRGLCAQAIEGHDCARASCLRIAEALWPGCVPRENRIFPRRRWCFGCGGEIVGGLCACGKRTS